MIETINFLSISTILQIGGIFLVLATALAYFVSQFQIGKSTARSNIIRDLNTELQIKQNKIEDQKKEILALTDALEKMKGTEKGLMRKVKEYKRFFERRDPTLTSLLAVNADVLKQVEKILEGGACKDGNANYHDEQPN